MNTPLRQTTSAASLLLFSLVTFSSCGINASAQKSQAVSEMSCDDANKIFSPSGAAQGGLLLNTLPAGDYTHVSAEIYFMLPTSNTTGKVTAVRAQYLETPNANTNPTTYTISPRCNEVSGTLTAFQQQAPMMSDFKTDLVNYSANNLSYTFALLSDGTSKFSVGSPIVIPGSSAAQISTTISNYWNAGVTFDRRAGDTYEFLGAHTDGSGITVYGKATYLRKDL